jgi:site-specific DNA-methyltransferase (adenine-specific)
MEEQGKLDIQAEKKMHTVEEYQFEPIKGFQNLHWQGKRPFTSTQYYPAQLKESYGNDINGWINKIYWGDNLQVMSHLLKSFRGAFKLIYIDPPFDSKADYKKLIKLKGKEVSNDQNSFEEKQYSDIWNNDDYLQFMYERLILLKELLHEDGIITLHCDYHKVHLLRCIMDEVFGPSMFKNEIIWCYTGASQSKSKFPSKHDNILVYAKSSTSEFHWKEIGIPYSEETLARTNRGVGETGLYGDDLEVATEKHKNRLKDGGKVPEDWWSDIYRLQGNGLEKVNYPTQKPEKLLERLIKAYTRPGDIVFDCFMGSGTTQASSMKLGRKFIGSDINLGAIETTIKRLNKLIKEINVKLPELDFEDDNDNTVKVEDFYTNFSVYNVNNYDVFRNPIQAKELLKQALEIQPLPNNTIYDGEKDGRMVKIMPVNRIATRADLNELISGFNIKSFEKKFETSPNKPVESLLLVCMGHEPDLGASLQKEMHPYKLDVEVVDILRDKSNLEFKRDSEAEISIENGKLIIKQFYPMNLLQKLSLMKENVEDWKELTESIKVDFNYDGAVFEPKIVDVPEKDEFVKGEYIIPEEAGTIRVKITDLLSESLELTIENK